MHVLHRTFSLSLGAAGGCIPILFVLASHSQSAANIVSTRGAQSPQQVADTLDKIVQPRFQKNAGRFGVDRTVELDGHGDVHWTDADTPAEKPRFASVKASHRSYVIAFLHCRHKPGAHIDPPTKPEPLDNFQPSTEALIAVGSTQPGAQKLYDWANKSLSPVVLPHLAQLKSGQGTQVDYQNWTVVMRPVRAEHQACLTCHAGSKRGDTLGVMVYAVDKNQKIKRRSFSAPGGA